MTALERCRHVVERFEEGPCQQVVGDVTLSYCGRDAFDPLHLIESATGYHAYLGPAKRLCGQPIDFLDGPGWFHTPNDDPSVYDHKPVEPGGAAVSLQEARPSRNVREEGGRMTTSEPLLCSVEDFADEVAIGVSLAWKIVREKRIPSVKVGRRRLVLRSEIPRFVETLMEEQNVDVRRDSATAEQVLEVTTASNVTLNARRAEALTALRDSHKAIADALEWLDGHGEADRDDIWVQLTDVQVANAGAIAAADPEEG